VIGLAGATFNASVGDLCNDSSDRAVAPDQMFKCCSSVVVLIR
jgi:hypothetical protein